ncbi:MAG: hypothetical protein GY701_08015 [Sulfitobacter sp.]|nr:hypothetical protein [Sulfitobacter sp.]
MGRLIGFVAALLIGVAVLGQPVLAAVVAPENGCCCVAPGSAAGRIAAGSVDDLLAGGRQVRGNFPRSAGPGEVLYRAGDDGAVTFYQLYDDLGNPAMRVDLVGPAHGGIPTPHVQEFVLNTNPATGQTFVNKGPVRAALPGEIPG